MNSLKHHLLEQQNFVKRLVLETQTNNAAALLQEKNEATPNNSPIPSVQEIRSEFSTEKVCPMCEAVFDATMMTHEDFVSHVNSHFSFEESETLHNYEFVDGNDASMS